MRHFLAEQSILYPFSVHRLTIIFFSIILINKLRLALFLILGVLDYLRMPKVHSWR